MDLELNDRDRLILRAVIQDYITTAEPVGSRILSKKHNLNLSPATIRNVMRDLEDQGLLRQPHASAGRVPTDQGLRYYVDSILEVRGLTELEERAIISEFAGLSADAEQLIRRTSRILSSVSRHLGVVAAPKYSQMILRQIQFIRVDRRRLLVILVGRNGMIQNRIVDLGEDMEAAGLRQEQLDGFNRRLNDILEGLTISEIKARLVAEMREEKNRFDQMYSRALALSQKVFAQDPDTEKVFIDGQVNLLDYPEFADVEAMKAIFKTFEDKSILVRLLDDTLNASGVRIFIGSEHELSEMEGLTLIASRYSHGARPLGVLGVIGPTRLDYSQIIPVVDFTANLVGKILEKTW
jgi:heat-inducible transcriptional repressor